MPSRSSNFIVGKSMSNNSILRVILILAFITLLLFFLIRMNKCTENFATTAKVPKQYIINALQPPPPPPPPSTQQVKK